ncbi:MAG: ribosome recycling factor [Deltaproteobacteria bacterium RBG_13_61_14]|nr:MAG: ribosome recycling factor [Deltaproteobacteria bacterium RBG_13_61_14]
MAGNVDKVFQELEGKVKKAAEDLQRQMGKIRSGRASANLLDDIKADSYGVLTPLRGMATINVPEPRLIIVQPFDPNSLKAIEKAIQGSDLGLHPQNDGKVLRINIPDLTEERRKELVKVVSRMAEEHRVAIRQIRKDANARLKELEKNKEIPEDELHRQEKKVQEKVDAGIKKVDEIAKAKEKEILAV